MAPGHNNDLSSAWLNTKYWFRIKIVIKISSSLHINQTQTWTCFELKFLAFSASCYSCHSLLTFIRQIYRKRNIKWNTVQKIKLTYAESRFSMIPITSTFYKTYACVFFLKKQLALPPQKPSQLCKNHWYIFQQRWIWIKDNGRLSKVSEGRHQKKTPRHI